MTENIHLLEKEHSFKHDDTSGPPLFNANDDSELEARGTSSIRNIITFFLLGLMVFTVLYLGMTAAQDILTETAIPTSSLLLTTAGPFFVATLMTPLVIPHVGPTLRITLVFVLMTSGIVLTSLGGKVMFKLIGVSLVSLGCGVAETSFLGMTALYEAATLSAYSGGTGAGFAIGPLYYTAMTTWACVSPQTTILTITALPLLILLIYVFLITQDLQGPFTLTKTLSYKRITHSASAPPTTLTWTEKLHVNRRALPITTVLVIGVICEYLALQAVVTTIAFENSPFTPRDHYEFYFFMFAAGELLGRGYAIVMHCLDTGCVYLTKHTWVFTLMLAANLAFLISVSWYRFLPSAWVIFLVLLEHGISAGALYVNTFSKAGTSEEDLQKQQFSRAFTTLGCGLGLLAAGSIGLAIEPRLRSHCVAMASTHKQAAFCFTRRMEGWNSTVHCRW